MRYMGSKAKLAKQLLPLILKNRTSDQWYVEPFVGGANLIDKVTGLRLGNDTNPYLIALLCAVRDGWIPPTELSQEEYTSIRTNKDAYPPELVGFVGFPCSFGGKWFNGYAQSEGRNHIAEGSRALLKQAPALRGVEFTCGSYLELVIPPKSLIYCDPPYANTTAYKDAFDHEVFWEWCRAKTAEGHTVFVSEYGAPEDFTCICEIQHVTTLNKNAKDARIERLFTVGNAGGQKDIQMQQGSFIM